MTWSPIWNLHLNHSQMNRNPVSLKFPLATSFLSFGAYALFSYINHTDPVSPRSPSTEEEEMRSWSQNLSDPKHKNYNPFSLNGK
jgi:hypothetical protein